MTLSRDRIAELARGLAPNHVPVKLCGELPEGWHNRPGSLGMLTCFEPLTDGRHEGPHINRAGDTWQQKRRPRAMERVEERRAASC